MGSVGTVSVECVLSGQCWLTVLVDYVSRQCWDSISGLYVTLLVDYVSGQCWDSIIGQC